MKRKLLLGINVLFFLSAPVYGENYNCEKLADCETLGYKSDQTCLDGIKVYCPTDVSKFYCNTVSPVINWPQAPLPILYGDGTVSKNILEDKKPIGVVFDEVNRLAVALTNVNKNGVAIWGASQAHPTKDTSGQGFSDAYVQWSSEGCDIPDLENCNFHRNDETQSNVMTCATNGKSNTAAILSGSCGGSFPAAEACHKYEPSGCTKDFCKAGEWFLPSVKEGNDLKKNKASIDKTLTVLSGTGTQAREIANYYYWSSVEGSEITYRIDEDAAKTNAMILDFYDDSLVCFAYYKGYFYYVRPVIKYPMVSYQAQSGQFFGKEFIGGEMVKP